VLLTIDVGNSNTVLGVFDGPELRAHWRLTTRREQTADEYGILVRNLFAGSGLDPARVEAIALASVVPRDGRRNYQGELLAPGPVEKKMFRMAMQDEARHVAYGTMHIRYAVEHDPDVADEIHEALDTGEAALVEFGTSPDLSTAIALLLAGGTVEAFTTGAAVLAGVAALAAGWRFKFVLVVRASFNQGYALPRIPVRGGK